MKCPNNKKHEIIMIEYSYGSPQRYDGISEYMCLEEKKRWGRWCEKELAENEIERRWCDGQPHPKRTD